VSNPSRRLEAAQLSAIPAIPDGNPELRLGRENMIHERVFRHSRTIGHWAGVLLWLGCCGAASAQERAVPLAPGDTYRAPALPERQHQRFRLEIEKAGLLTLDLSAPFAVTVAPALEVVATRPGSRIYWVGEPGPVEVQLASAVPGQPLGAYRLRSAFVAQMAPVMKEIAMPGDPPYSCAFVPASLGDPLAGSQGVVATEAVDEWDCDVLEGQTLAPGILRLESRLGTLRALLFGGDACGSDTLLGMATLSAVGQIVAPLFPGPFRIAVDAAGGFTGAYRIAAALLDPCHQGEQDDHHDSWLCATALPAGEPVAGEIGNLHGDDVDQFTFQLAEPAVVAIELASPADGFRLRVADAAGQGFEGMVSPVGWKGSLAAGRYFMSVDRPDGSAAVYQVKHSAMP
jgi:hypothetical protein